MRGYGDRVIRRQVLTQGGRLVTKSYTIGKGPMREVSFIKDKLGRYVIKEGGMVVPRFRSESSKAPSRQEIADSISSAFGSMSMNNKKTQPVRRGRGVVFV